MISAFADAVACYRRKQSFLRSKEFLAQFIRHENLIFDQKIKELSVLLVCSVEVVAFKCVHVVFLSLFRTTSIPQLFLFDSRPANSLTPTSKSLPTAQMKNIENRDRVSW